MPHRPEGDTALAIMDNAKIHSSLHAGQVYGNLFSMSVGEIQVPEAAHKQWMKEQLEGGHSNLGESSQVTMVNVFGGPDVVELGA